MAITTIIPDLLTQWFLMDNPGTARLERRLLLASDNTLVKRNCAVFADNVDGVIDPEIIHEQIMPSQYPNTTGVTLTLAIGSENATAGNVVFGLSVENILDTGSSTKVYNSNSQWGTEATGTIAMPTVAYEVKMGTVALVKANFGGDAAAAGTTAQLIRVRVRRLTSNASDTYVGNCLVFGVSLAETG